MGLGLPELLIILVIVFLVFGAGKLPDVMSQLGKGVQAFKDGATEKPVALSKAIKPKLAAQKASGKTKTATKAPRRKA